MVVCLFFIFWKQNMLEYLTSYWRNDNKTNSYVTPSDPNPQRSHFLFISAIKHAFEKSITRINTFLKMLYFTRFFFSSIHRLSEACPCIILMLNFYLPSLSSMIKIYFLLLFNSNTSVLMINVIKINYPKKINYISSPSLDI